MFTIDLPTAACFALGFVVCLVMITAAGGAAIVALAIGAGAIGSIPGCVLMASLQQKTTD